MHILSASVSLLISVICSTPLVLDPNIKNAYALDKWETDAYVEVISRLEDVVRHSWHHALVTFTEHSLV